MTGEVEFGAAALEGLAGLDEVVARSATVHAERPALWVGGETLSYAEIHAAAGRVAGALGDCGAGGQCGVLAARSVAAFAGVLGALFAGRAYVPLNPRHPPGRLLTALIALDADTVVVDRAAMPVAEAVLSACRRPLRILFPDAPVAPDWMRGSAHEALCSAEILRAKPPAPRRAAPEDAAYLLFTSGSTGAPKGVLIRHRNVLAYLRAGLARWRPVADDRFTQLFDFSFDLSVHDMFVCWAAGACLYCPPAAALACPASFVDRHALSCWFSVPSTAAMMDQLHRLDAGSLPSLRLSLFCGEALSPSLARKWRRAAPNAVVENLYGPTEATVAITAHRLRDDTAARWASVPIGRPFVGQEAVVIDAEGRMLPDGAVGELCLGGSQVAEGYWRLPDATARAFAPPAGLSSSAGARWYRTGDRVVKHPDSGLIFLGRFDRQVKLRGHRVELGEIEAVLRAAGGTESVAALAWPAEPGPARHIVAFIAGEARPAEAVLVACREKLPPAAVPREVRFLHDWPLNANGKTDHAALARLIAVPASGLCETEGDDVEGIVAQANGA